MVETVRLNQLECLLEAVGKDDIEQVRSLVQQIDDVASRQAALMAAVQNKSHDIVGLLLGNGLSPDEGHPSHPNGSPLTLACRNMDIPMIGQLLSHGADPYKKVQNTDRPIDIALKLLLRFEDMEVHVTAIPRTMLRLMLDSDDGTSDPEGKGCITLGAAVHIGHLVIVKKLLERGVPPDHADLMVAYRQRNMGLVNLLLEHGADPHAAHVYPMKDGESGKCLKEMSPIGEAIAKSDTDAMRMMLDSNDGRTKANGKRYLAMLAAFLLGDTNTMNSLFKLCIEADDEFIEDQIYEAVRSGQVKGVEMLVRYKGDINMEVKTKKLGSKGTLLEVASDACVETLADDGCVLWLLEHGADTHLALSDQARKPTVTVPIRPKP